MSESDVSLTMSEASTPEAYPEAAAILRDAGWKPHDAWGVYTRGTLVMGFSPDGQHFDVKNWGRDIHGPDTPDDPVEAAQWLVAFRLPALAQEEEPAETPQHESDGETGEEASTQSGESVREGDAGLSEAPESHDAPRESESAQADASGLLGQGVAQFTDADFEAIEELGAQDELAETDFETLAIEGADAEPEAPAQDGPIAYGASTIDGLIREKLGRVSQIARELKAVQQEGWTVEEYAYLQNLMVRMDRGEAPDDQASRERFLAIAVKSQAMSRIDAVRDRKEGELEEIGQRRDFDAAVYYEPGEGWPA